MSQEILSEVPLSTVDVREILKGIKKEQGDLNFRAQKTLDHLELVATLKATDAKKLEEALGSIGVSRLRDLHVKKLVSIMPTTEDDVKMVMSGFNVTLSSDDAKNIAKTISEYA